MNQKYRCLALAIPLVAGLLGPGSARATTLLYMTTAELTAQATLIFVGKVLYTRVAQDQGMLWTDAHVMAGEVIKGDAVPGQVVVLREPGGETATLGLKVPGAARFTAGEEVLVFAEELDGRLRRVVGMCLGKYSLTHPKDGEPQASRDTSEASIAHRDSDGKLIIIPPVKQATPPGEATLKELRGAIDEALKAALEPRKKPEATPHRASPPAPAARKGGVR